MKTNRASVWVGWLSFFWVLALPACAKDSAWPEWDRFAERFVQADGRVIDITFDAKSTSEGQSYGLFFALVANRPDHFERILTWTSDNLANGELGRKLPGWLWGKRDDGVWAIKDTNAASDADLWIAYTLMEAGRLWREPRYDKQGRQLLALIAEHEVVKAGKAGTLLLPGPVGFELSNQRYRFNPSYLPGFQLTYLAHEDPKGPWADIWSSYLKLAPQIFASGVAPDNLIVDSKGNVMPDSERAPSGSYDAIRVYMWAGMSGDNSKELLRLLSPYAKLIRKHGAPPEKVDPATGAVVKADWSPPGFMGASLPYLRALRDEESLQAQEKSLFWNAQQAKLGRATNYYDEALILFGKGWHDGYYKFDSQGRLQPKWLAKE
ncbi:MAG TPA: cellulose synthase complex periplasmic endoglucanase BcsZ [Steroidobacteraceae bacterium]|nr:cellulose synthase complex periplasmic endoglucanase BcsZ [Steroidobacteraceae bacterium]